MNAGWWLAVMYAVLGAGPGIASAQHDRPVTRGELLYTTYCIACHSTKLHWRDEKLAKDWASLNSQVRRWQRNSELKWSDDDIAEAARYLNSNYYHYPEPAE